MNWIFGPYAVCLHIIIAMYVVVKGLHLHILPSWTTLFWKNCFFILFNLFDGIYLLILSLINCWTMSSPTFFEVHHFLLDLFYMLAYWEIWVQSKVNMVMCSLVGERFGAVLLCTSWNSRRHFFGKSDILCHSCIDTFVRVGI